MNSFHPLNHARNPPRIMSCWFLHVPSLWEMSIRVLAVPEAVGERLISALINGVGGRWAVVEMRHSGFHTWLEINSDLQIITCIFIWGNNFQRFSINEKAKIMLLCDWREIELSIRLSVPYRWSDGERSTCSSAFDFDHRRRSCCTLRQNIWVCWHWPSSLTSV